LDFGSDGFVVYVLQFDRTELAAMMQQIQVSGGVVPSPGLANEKEACSVSGAAVGCCHCWLA